MSDKSMNATDLDRILAANIEDLTPNEMKIRLKALEEKISIIRAVAPGNKSSSDLSGLGPDDFVLINMPASPQGDIFNLNGQKYPPGQHKVLKRVAEHLTYLVSESWKVEKERLISRSNHFQSALLRGEDLARVERFEQIMKED